MKTTLIKLSCTALAILQGSSMAMGQSKLNATLPSSSSTIGSEIKRGADAADRCSAMNIMPTRVAAFVDCVDTHQSANRQSMANGYEAFDVGLYVNAKTNIGVAIDILGQAGRDVALLQARFNLYDVRYRQVRDKLHLTDAEAQRGVLLGS